MAKQARYIGPFDEVNIGWPPGAVPAEQTWTVKRDGRLPEDAPAALRDELLTRDDFVEYPQDDDSKPSGKRKDGDS